MMGCSIDADPNVTEARTEVGLVRGHAYSITKVVKAQIETPQASGEIPLIRIRNPWGNEAEWNGAWSDRYVGNFCYRRRNHAEIFNWGKYRKLYVFGLH